MKLIELIRELPLTSVQNHGTMISFIDIYEACAAHGQDNHHIINAQLIALEKDDSLKVIYDDQELIIGVRL